MSSESYLKKLKEKINDITECAICTEILSDSRVLPCMHSYCLKCLQSWGKDKVTTDKSIECPLCRKPFRLESGRFEDLPINHFINKLIDANNMFDRAEGGESSKQFCDICQGMNCAETAEAYCVECREYLCIACHQRHGIQRAAKTHKTVTLLQMPSPGELLKMSVSYCQTHPSQELGLYCDDCRTTACVICYVAKHKEHKCTDITSSSNELSEQIDESLLKINDQMKETESIVKQINTSISDFDKQIKAAQDSVTRKYDEMRALLACQHETLLVQLCEARSKRLKELQILKEESERELIMMKDFEKYWSELKSKGSVYDIVQAASSLQKRAEDLINQYKTQQNKSSNKSRKGYCKIEFIPAESNQNQTEDRSSIVKLLGHISEWSESLNRTNLDWRLLMPGVKNDVVLQGRSCIVGVTISNNELFIVRSRNPKIDVYKLNNRTTLRQINIADLTRPGGVVSCEISNSLYVSNQTPPYIHKISLKDDSQSGWRVLASRPYGLSLSLHHHLLVSFLGTGLIEEYDTCGKLLRSIQLSGGISGIYHAIELNSEQLVVSSCEPHPLICVVDSNGSVIHSSAKSNGPQLSYPLHIGVDDLGNILVPNHGYSKFPVFSRALQYLGDVRKTLDKISNPMCFFWCATSRRLFVGERTGTLFSLSI